jgi:hypothetical protein
MTPKEEIMTVDFAMNAAPRISPAGGEPQTPALAKSMTRVGAQSRLTSELRSIAVDLLGPYESDELPADSARWMDATIESVVSAVCNGTLAALVSALEARLAGAPLEVARQLDELRVRHDAGLL